MKIGNYPDGSSYVITDDLKPYQTFRVNSYKDLWHLNQLVDAYASRYPIRLSVTIPNLIDAQADRRFNIGESSGLKLVCKFLNGMNADFKIFHPHNAEVVEAMMDNVEIIDNQGFIEEVLVKIHHYNGGAMEDNTILISSDAGGFKPLMKLCDQLNWDGETFSASKARTKDSMKQLVDRKDFGGKDVLIIDDLCVYGGTFKGLSKLLREKNCGKLYLAVSHMTVQNLGDDPVTNYFDKVFTTNSKFNHYEVGPKGIAANDHLENLEIIKLF